jgi:cytochrome c oxidase subunit 2
MDVIPGHVNKLGFVADTVGEYYGECAEFCGDEHAWMRFKVIVDPPDKFDQWVQAYKLGPNPAAAQAVGVANVTQAPAAFSLCLGCHRINGVTQTSSGGAIAPQVTGMQGAETNGPNLTLLGCRTTIGAGILSNTPDNLKKWLEDPGAVKPGNFMATQIKKGTLKPDQINELVTYLEGQQYEGCQTP